MDQLFQFYLANYSVMKITVLTEYCFSCLYRNSTGINNCDNG